MRAKKRYVNVRFFLSPVSLHALINCDPKIFAGHDLGHFSDGFLHSMQAALGGGAWQLLTELLGECVNCDRMRNCANRFGVAKRLRELLMHYERPTGH